MERNTQFKNPTETKAEEDDFVPKLAKFQYKSSVHKIKSTEVDKKKEPSGKQLRKKEQILEAKREKEKQERKVFIKKCDREC